MWQDEKGNLELDNVRSSVDYEQCLFFSLGCRPRFSRAVASPLDARLRTRAPPSLNLKKKIDCSQSRILAMFCIQNMQKVLKVKTSSVNVKSSFFFCPSVILSAAFVYKASIAVACVQTITKL